MFCPRCRGEYRAGFARCAHCGIDLVDKLPPEDVFSSPESMARALGEREVQALLVGNHVELAEAQRFLAGRRIASVLAGEADDAVETAVHHRLFLMVSVEDLERARDAVHERWREGAISQGLILQDKPLDLGTCPACGVATGANAAECPECGLFLGDAEGQGGKSEPA